MDLTHFLSFHKPLDELYKFSSLYNTYLYIYMMFTKPFLESKQTIELILQLFTLHDFPHFTPVQLLGHLCSQTSSTTSVSFTDHNFKLPLPHLQMHREFAELQICPCRAAALHKIPLWHPHTSISTIYKHYIVDPASLLFVKPANLLLWNYQSGDYHCETCKTPIV
jgi:hypothetical protein